LCADGTKLAGVFVRSAYDPENRDGLPNRSAYAPEVATVASPVIAAAASVVTGAATLTVPSALMVTLSPCLTPPRTAEVATGNEYADGMLGLLLKSA
jgi:hypothetical protein